MTKRVRISIDGERIEKRFINESEAEKWLKEMISKHSDESLEGEEWKVVPGFSRYQASNFGRVRSLNYKNSGLIKVVSPSLSKDGYLKSMFQRDNKTYITRPIHFMVACAWHGVKKCLTIDHVDGNKQNNYSSNLEWVTRSENCLRSFQTGCQQAKVGELNGMSKLTREQIDYVRDRKEKGGRFWGRNEIAKELGISPKHLQRIVNKPDQTWYNV